jgi:histone H3/H4
VTVFACMCARCVCVTARACDIMMRRSCGIMAVEEPNLIEKSEVVEPGGDDHDAWSDNSSRVSSTLSSGRSSAASSPASSRSSSPRVSDADNDDGADTGQKRGTVKQLPRLRRPPALRGEGGGRGGRLVFSRAAVRDLMNEWLQQEEGGRQRLRISAAAVRAVHDAAESHLADVFEMANTMRQLQGRKTLQLAAFRVAARVVELKHERP